MQYLARNELGGNWTLRFLAYVQELDPRPRPGPQHNTSYYSHFLDVRATIQVQFTFSELSLGYQHLQAGLVTNLKHLLKMSLSLVDFLIQQEKCHSILTASLGVLTCNSIATRIPSQSTLGGAVV